MSKGIYEFGECDYCGTEDTILRSSPFMADMGKLMCKMCWDMTEQEYKASEDAHIGKFEDGSGYEEAEKNLYKVLKVTMPDGSVWEVQATIIASSRARYYAGQDTGETEGEAFRKSFTEEYLFTLEDDEELIDWAENNMNWEYVKEFALMVQEPKVDYQDGWVNGEKEIISKMETAKEQKDHSLSAFNFQERMEIEASIQKWPELIVMPSVSNTNSIKCMSCKHNFIIVPSKGNPHGEYACMKRDKDLQGVKAEDVENCEDYETNDINIPDMSERRGYDDC